MKTQGFDSNFLGVYWGWAQLFCSVLFFASGCFPICYFILNDLSIVDILWGLMFLIPNGILLADRITSKGPDSVTDLQKLTVGLVYIWGLRLAIHIGRRHKGEDWRYTMLIRPAWKNKGPVGQCISAYCYVFLMQATFSMVVNSSALFIMRYSVKESDGGDRLTPLQLIGTIVAFLGLLCEIWADMTLQSHRDDPGKKGQLCKAGLWRLSRHPNYFGESLFWWGIFIMAYSLQGGIKTVYSAVFITYLVRWLSGAEMLEKWKQRSRPEFRVYMKETSIFVPWFYKEIKGDTYKLLMEKFTKEIEDERAKRQASREKKAKAAAAKKKQQ